MREDLATFELDEAYEIIRWLVHLLGGSVTISDDEQFWADNGPIGDLIVGHDGEGQPVLAIDYRGREKHGNYSQV